MSLKQTIHVALTDSTIVSRKQLRNVLISTFLISIFLSLTQLYADSVVNSDGMLYLQVASFIQKEDWGGAAKLYNWLTFPYLIALLSSLSTLSLENSAYLLNTIFTASTCAIFVIIVGQLGGYKKNILLFASCVIICFPKLNEYRNMVIRDHGYWAFHLLSCLFFFISYEKASYHLLFFFICSTVFAALFRVEGIVLLALVPFIINQLRIKSNNNKVVITFYIICLLSIITIFAWVSTNNITGFTKVTSSIDKVLLLFSTDSTYIQHAKNYLMKIAPLGYSQDYATAVLALTFSVILITEIFSTTTPLYIIGLIYSIYKKQFFSNPAFIRPWLLLIFLNLFLLSSFLFSHFFLSGRYPVALSMVLLLLLPFTAKHLYSIYVANSTHTKKHRWFIYLFAVLFFFSTLDSLLSFGTKKNYLKEAGIWIESSMKHSTNTLYSNSAEVIFYSNTFKNKRPKDHDLKHVIKKIKSKKLEHYAYVAIKVSRKETNQTQELVNIIGTKPIKIFSNKRNDQLLIFKQ